MDFKMKIYIEGPPGCGKSSLARGIRAYLKRCGVTFLPVEIKTRNAEGARWQEE